MMKTDINTTIKSGTNNLITFSLPKSIINRPLFWILLLTIAIIHGIPKHICKFIICEPKIPVVNKSTFFAFVTIDAFIESPTFPAELIKIIPKKDAEIPVLFETSSTKVTINFE